MSTKVGRVSESPRGDHRQDRYGFIDWLVLPQPNWEQYWDRIYVAGQTKQRLHNYAQFVLSRREQMSVVGLPVHGIALLRGMPGTGKSSLVKGLAQKIATENGEEVLFANVNAHTLPSQMLGDSQRNTMNLLERAIPELAEKGHPMVVLVDEVESIAMARDRASSGADPVDVARATEASLHGLDHLATLGGRIVIFATSNFAQAIDPAFVSRLDLVVDIALPDESTVAAILDDALSEVASEVAPGARDRFATALTGLSGRDVRKTVFDALVSRNSSRAIDDPLTEADIEAVLHWRTQSSPSAK
jgi:AAA+ superfamily predicted ATPase